MSPPVETQNALRNEQIQILLEAVLQIERAKDEYEAVVEAMRSLEKLKYKQVMIAFLVSRDGEQCIVGEPALTTGEKWKAVAADTIRSYDTAVDLLPLVLRRKQSRFIRDSRSDPDRENDEELCNRLKIISQYVMPLATESMSIGTLQVDMGVRNEKPDFECMMLDALAAHLSLAIERHRTLIQLQTAQNELMSKSKLIAYEAAAAQIMHSLSHSIGDYAKVLNVKRKSQAIRNNKEAYEFLEETHKRVSGWVDNLEASTLSFRRLDSISVHQVEDVIKNTVNDWYRKAKHWNCNITTAYNSAETKVTGRLGALRELFSCLIVNAIEANARRIIISTDITSKVDSSGLLRDYVEILVKDDGDGVPLEYKTRAFELGWTTKSKRGHGLGLTLVAMLTKEIGGFFELRSFGKSANDKLTEFAVYLPKRGA